MHGFGYFYSKSPSYCEKRLYLNDKLVYSEKLRDVPPLDKSLLIFIFIIKGFYYSIVDQCKISKKEFTDTSFPRSNRSIYSADDNVPMERYNHWINISWRPPEEGIELFKVIP